MIPGMSKDSKPSEDPSGVEVNTIKALMALLREDIEVCLIAATSPATSCLVLLRHSDPPCMLYLCTPQVNRAQTHKQPNLTCWLRVFGAMIFILIIILFLGVCVCDLVTLERACACVASAISSERRSVCVALVAV